MKLGVILGNQLFSKHKLNADHYFMAEDRSLCTHFKYHKHKIILFLSAMRSHADTIDKIDYYKLDNLTYEAKLLKTVKKRKIKEIITYDIEDKFFEKRIKLFCKKNKLELTIIDSPAFLTSKKQFSDWIGQKKKVLFNDFYIHQRKRLGILVKDETPKNGKWSFDDQNRKKLPKEIKIPRLPIVEFTKHTKEVIKLVESEFSKHPGDSSNFWLPTTRKDALKWMNNFFKLKFESFGPYEDAISKDNNFIFHSVLSPLINLGIITPKECIDKALKYDVHYPSKEGFIRQIIGWREFVRGVYNHLDFEKNFFDHERKLSKKWYTGETGIPPLDDAIKNVIKYGYTHHINRLMIIGNLMLLCEIHPKEVNKWFMELFVDSSDWVMIPNVYGMSQFADGGSFATKPYICGSNYMLKMSDYRKGDWCEIVDGLYWRFVAKHKKLFSSNMRMNYVVSAYEKMDITRKKKIIGAANRFLKSN